MASGRVRPPGPHPQKSSIAHAGLEKLRGTLVSDRYVAEGGAGQGDLVAPDGRQDLGPGLVAGLVQVDDGLRRQQPSVTDRWPGAILSHVIQSRVQADKLRGVHAGHATRPGELPGPRR
jgi:hypothetical protein